MRKLLSFFIVMLLTVSLQAKVHLSHLITPGMVLQQQSEVNLWGWAAPGKVVTVTTSWNKAVYKATADADGRFKVAVKTPAASNTAYEVTFSDGEKTTVGGVLIGEVWVCAGQSNMEITMGGFGNCPVEGLNEAIVESPKLGNIHFVKVPSVMSTKPLDDFDGEWKAVGPETVADCSAVGYFFARTVNRALDIPVGLVMANKGGSRVESWLTEANLRAHTQETLDSLEMTKKWSWDFHYPLLWGNGTFNPIINYGVKGILWYQGCSNVGDPGNQYSERLSLLARQWREQFGRGDIPFYIVEIAPYNSGDKDGDWCAKLREQQVRASEIIPNAAIVSTNDCVYPWEGEQIHPTIKKPIGERLAFLALSREYGFKKLRAESMKYKEMTIQGDTCYLRFSNMYDGISRYNGIKGFEVAGDDRVFYPAEAGHFWVPGNDPRNESVWVASDQVKNPVAVRYCFKNFQLGNLGNNGQLPLLPFRTDNWDWTKKPVEVVEVASKVQFGPSDLGQQPVVVVDGKVMSSEDLESVDPANIKSIDVLKDKKQLKKYGKQAENGVVVITMK